MDNEKLDSNIGRKPIPAYILPYEDLNDEAGLVDLWQILTRRKWLILVSVLLVLVLSTIYMWSARDTYTASAYLLPPSFESINELLVNLPGPGMTGTASNQAYFNPDDNLLEKYGVETITPGFVFRAYLRNFNSNNIKQEFSDTEQVNSITIIDPQNNFLDAVARLTSQDPVSAAHELSQYIAYVDKRTGEQLTGELQSIVDIELKKAVRNREIKLNNIKENALRMITGQGEAISTLNKTKTEGSRIFYLWVPPEAGKPFLMGLNAPGDLKDAEALEYLIEGIKSDDTVEYYTPELDKLEEYITYLEGVSFDPEKISVITMDKPPTSVIEPDRANWKLVFSASIILGLMTGILIAIVVDLIGRGRSGPEVNSRV
ncbi:hypothetical protein TspCOW1_04710 [Thiohalobacter sp. COW1]|uniref:Wzz/FepE/Etk N-terminal domain-containing protein n=1 Tax=Thiohalobacter sp. COW1 TaxID=2795687 RepID=UPI001915EB1B|nr:Wzz/FepE/Etk N-terminal domain-containing protein [Thiohalobacter sp. COW1]BCO30368.1 hypothetical protein TspCOW1_04710 [Thiohalobacter sp. COW1]